MTPEPEIKRKAIHHSTTVAPVPLPPHRPPPPWRQHQLHGLIRLIRTENDDLRRRGICLHCREAGHTAAECPRNALTQPRATAASTPMAAPATQVTASAPLPTARPPPFQARQHQQQYPDGMRPWNGPRRSERIAAQQRAVTKVSLSWRWQTEAESSPSVQSSSSSASHRLWRCQQASFSKSFHASPTSHSSFLRRLFRCTMSAQIRLASALLGRLPTSVTRLTCAWTKLPWLRPRRCARQRGRRRRRLTPSGTRSPRRTHLTAGMPGAGGHIVPRRAAAEGGVLRAASLVRGFWRH